MISQSAVSSAPTTDPVATGNPDFEAMLLSGLITQLSAVLVRDGDVYVEIRNEAGDYDNARGVYVKDTRYSGPVCRITTNGENC